MRYLCFFLGLALVAAPQAKAGESSFSLDMAVVGQYIFRGVQIDDEPSLQPSLTWSYGLDNGTSLSLNGWWNIALDDHGSDVWKDVVFEQDFTLTVSHQLGESSSLSYGYIYYSNPQSDIAPGIEEYQTDEVFLGIDLELARLAFGVYAYYDLDLFSAFYFSTDVAWDLWSTERFSLEPSLRLGFASESDAWYEESGLVESLVALTATYTVNEHLSLGSAVSYGARHDDWKKVSGGLDEDYLWASVFLGLSY